MNPSNRNNFVLFTTILLLTIFGVETLNMALLVLLKAKRKQIVNKFPSNGRAISEQVFVSVQKFIRTKFCRVPCKR